MEIPDCGTLDDAKQRNTYFVVALERHVKVGKRIPVAVKGSAESFDYRTRRTEIVAYRCEVPDFREVYVGGHSEVLPFIGILVIHSL